MSVFGNIKKAGSKGGTSFQPAYNGNNQMSGLGGLTPTYDANGNLTFDTYHPYAWDAENGVWSIDSSYLTHDAFERVVEIGPGANNTVVVYAPTGQKLSLLSASTESLIKGFVPLPGGGTAVVDSTGAVAYYRHPDWLGSSPLASTTSRTVYYDGAYAPYGENYAETGTTDRNFTGQEQDAANDLYDFAFREYSPAQGRWISPDPAGLAAVDPTNPQSWNRYAYALNSPCSMVDPSGLDPCNFNVAVNNAAGLSPGQLSAAEAQINAVLGAVASLNGDTVGANFTFSAKADYNLNIVNGNPNGDLGTQSYFLGIPFLPGPTNVNAAAIGSVFSNAPGAINQVIGTVGAHELTHRITGVGDLPFGGGPNDVPGLMQIDSFTQQYPAQAAGLYLNPYGLLLTPSQVSGLYRRCNKKHPNGNQPGGGGGLGVPSPGPAGSGPTLWQCTTHFSLGNGEDRGPSTWQECTPIASY